MSVVRARLLGALICGIAFGASLASAQPLPQFPQLTLDAFPPVSREPIARALAEARAHPQDAAAAARVGMLLHAWEQWEAAAAVYAHVRRLERRFEWLYLAGVVEERLAHHQEAAALFRDALTLSPAAIPARLKLADALLESGALEEAEQAFGALAGEPSAEPHAQVWSRQNPHGPRAAAGCRRSIRRGRAAVPRVRRCLVLARARVAQSRTPG